MRALLVLAVLILAGCGFHLRQSIALPAELAAIRVEVVDSYSPLQRNLEQALADQVAAEREALQAVLFEQRALVAHVAVRGEGLLDVEMVAPAGEFQPVIAHRLGERREFGKR